MALYRYRLYLEDGSEAGDAHYAVLIRPGETIRTNDGRRLRVVDVAAVEDAASEYVGLLTVEAA
jgi:ribosomal protein L14